VYLSFPEGVERVWLGPELYANRLMDWRLRDGRIEAIESSAAKPMRTVHLLTSALRPEDGMLEMSVRVGTIAAPLTTEASWAGFLLGAGGAEVDYRITALVHHWPSTDGGLIVGLDGTDRIVVRDNSINQGYRSAAPDIPTDAWPLIEPESSEQSPGAAGWRTLSLRAFVEQSSPGYRLDIQAQDAEGTVVARATYRRIPDEHLIGSLALASHRAAGVGEGASGPGHWFDDWWIWGNKLMPHPDRAFGPITGAFHTLSGGVLRLTAQMVPLSDRERRVDLQLQRDGSWETVASAPIAPLSETATFTVADWRADTDIPYRVRYELAEGAEAPSEHLYEGVVRREPVDKEQIVLAALNCHHISGGDGAWNSSHFWYPHSETAAGVAYHQPDVLFFAGDQIYESGLAGIVREPTDAAALDYLYHWYRFVWAFRDLARDIPTVMIPDDHDVYHGNIWGAGGIAAVGDRVPRSDSGGYIMAPEWVNAVHRTQVSNLPVSPDPEPIAQGISVYHTEIDYAGISFAVIADRMFKSSPAVAVPAGEVVNGWPQAPGFDPATQADVEGAVLLGERQEAFLERWAADWSGGTWMKVVLSQTLFANVATLPPEAASGAVLPSLDNPEPDEYPTDYKLAADMDSNGWPQSGRNRALRTMRKGFAFHVVGDQHLGSFVHYGIDAFNDAGYGFVVPSIANIWPRRWFPPEPGANRDPDAPRYTGEYLDGFGNRMTVMAVSNPVSSGREPAALYDRVPGYGIVRFDRATRRITAENWPRWVDPSAPDARQYYGWPITVDQVGNYGREPAAYLPELRVQGIPEPVIQVVNEITGEIVYTYRAIAPDYLPPVFDADASYTVRVGEPGTDRWRELTGLRTTQEDPIDIRF